MQGILDIRKNGVYFDGSNTPRFRKLFLPRYTEEQFLNVSEKVLPKLSPGIARYISSQVWRNDGDIRGVQGVGRLVRKSDGPEQIELIIKTMMKYGKKEREGRGMRDENSARL